MLPREHSTTLQPPSPIQPHAPHRGQKEEGWISYSRRFLTLTLETLQAGPDEPVPFLLSLPVSAFTFKQGQAHIYSLKKKKKGRGESGQSIAQVGGCNTQRLLCDEVAWTKRATWGISCLSASRNVLLAPMPSPQWSRIQDHETL